MFDVIIIFFFNAALHFAVASENLEKTRNELTQTKADLSHLTTKLNCNLKFLNQLF